MKNYYMGIDNGGTLSKAVIFDRDGNEISKASCEVPLIKAREGFTERDMNVLWDANCKIIKEAIDKSGLEPGQIKAVACTGHGKGLYLWGKDGNPCYNGIVSTDSRAYEYPIKWEENGVAQRVFEKTYQKILACQPVSLLAWMKDNNPEVIENIKWIFEVKDYIRFKLTGKAYAEITDYSGSNLMNIRDKRFDKELLQEFGLEDMYEKLPPLKESYSKCGKITSDASKQTGLAIGTVVAGGMFDIDACAIAMDITNEDYIAVIAGTWSINEYISKTPVLDKSVMMNSIYCIEDYYLIEECSPTSAGNHSWFIDTFMEHEKQIAESKKISVYEYFDEIASESEPGDQNIIFLPYIYGSNYNPKAKAGLIGLASHHSKSQIAMSILEGIAFCHRVHLDKLLQSKKNTTAVRLAGGAANSKIWPQIFADVFGLPVEIIDTKELGTLGCAIAGAVACGEYENLGEAAKEMVKVKKRFEPMEKNKIIYEKKYDLYKKVSESLNNLWEEF